ncbi:hypothetical protein COTS27_00705 [Spirochaetota bacterium]|nr:hypothetical protein COTS27_00705 [Spirochaetota bacterium]
MKKFGIKLRIVCHCCHCCHYIVIGFSILLGCVSILAAREVSFQLSEIASSKPKSGYVLTISSEDFVLVSDQTGLFKVVNTEVSVIDLAAGSYEYELTDNTSLKKGNFSVNAETVVPIAIPLADAKNGEVTTEAETTSDVRRLATVRVKKERFSEKRLFTAGEARKLPGTGGDVLGVLDSLPGIISATGVFDTDLFIRGGAAGDISYRYNDIVIGSPYHEIFFFSVFPPELLSGLLFFPGGYPAKYDNVQGSVVDILDKDFYDYDKFYSVDLNLSLIVASLSASIEFLDKFRITFGGRRSYLEAYIALADAVGALNALGDFRLTPIFYDAHFIFDWQIDPTRLLKFVFLFSGDEFVFNTKNAEFQGATPEEKIFIDSSLRFGKTWDSEALSYSSKQDKYDYDILFYRYAERIKSTNQNTERYNLTNEEYSLRGSFNYVFNPFFSLDNYLKYSLDRGYGLNKVHPNGLQPPDPANYLTFEADGRPNGERLQEFINANILYNSQLVDLRESFLRHRLTLGSSLITSLKQVTFDTGFIFYYDNISQANVNGDFRLRTTYAPPVNTGNLEVFAYAGRFTQFPAIAIENEDNDAVFFQDYALKTPHTYQFGTGTSFLGAGFEVSLEGYYKLFRNQILFNPTYDTQYAKSPENWPTVNVGKGTAYGIEFLVRRLGNDWYSGWLSYTWSRAFVDRFSIPFTEDRGNVFSDPANNGLDYQTLRTVRAPYEENAEHTIKFLSLFKLSKRVSLSFEIIGSSGKPYSPKVIGTNSTFTRSTGCTGLECDSGLVFVDDPSRINGARLPWTLSINIRFDWIFYKSRIVEASLFIDVIALESAFYTNVTGYTYNRAFIRVPGGPYTIGMPAPTDIISELGGNAAVIPVLGFEFKF